MPISDNIPEVFKLIADGLKIAVNNIESNLDKAMDLFKNELKTEQFSGKRGAVGIGSKTGKAKGSLQVTTKKTNEGISINLHSDVDYIRIHENITHKLDLGGAMNKRGPVFEKIVLKNLEQI